MVSIAELLSAKQKLKEEEKQYKKQAVTYKAMDTYFEGMTEIEKTQQVYKILRDLHQI